MVTWLEGWGHRLQQKRISEKPRSSHRRNCGISTCKKFYWQSWSIYENKGVLVLSSVKKPATVVGLYYFIFILVLLVYLIQVQLTDFENAAYVVFIVLLTRVILTFHLNFLIPISKVCSIILQANWQNLPCFVLHTLCIQKICPQKFQVKLGINVMYEV